MNSCELCGRVAPTAYVSLYRNIGLLVARQLCTTKGQMCRSCAREKWLSESLLTLFLGWWGVISFFVNCFCVLNALLQIPTVFGIPADGHARDEGGGGSRTGLVVGGALAVGLALLVGFGVHSSGAKNRRITELDQRSAKARTERKLETLTACDLVEAQLLRGLRGSSHVARFGCAGPLKLDVSQALLEGVTTHTGEEPFAVCLERGPSRWFVSTVGACAKAELHTDISLSLEQQETAWRATQARALVAERREALDANLLEMKKQLDAEADADEPTIPGCSAEVLDGYTQPYGSAPTIDARALGAGHEGRGGELDFLTSYDAKEALTGQSTEAIESLERTRLVAVIGEHAVAHPPQLKGSSAFESGFFLGRVFLADVSKGRVLCSKTLLFESSKGDMWISTSKYASQSSKELQFRTKLATDFQSQYRSAVRTAVDGAFKPAAQAKEDDRKMLMGVLGSMSDAHDDDAVVPAAFSRPLAKTR